MKKLEEILKLNRPFYDNNYIVPYESALIIDSLYLLIEQAYSIVYNNNLILEPDILLKSNSIYLNNNEGKNCTSSLSNNNHDNKYVPWSIGKLIMNKLFLINNQIKDNQRHHEDGLTGPINFNILNGERINYTIHIFKKAINLPIIKVGLFKDNLLVIQNEQLFRTKNVLNAQSQLLNRKKIITTVEDEPFLMIKKPKDGEILEGNDRYEGYCVDLAKKIAEICNFTYEIRLVKDGQYGSYIEKTGEWNGMIGEILRDEADMSIAPLTISAIRESVVEFSKPFMDIGISIMILKSKETPGLLSFMKPFSTHIYVCIILAYIAVTVILFLVSRFSPYEWIIKRNNNENNIDTNNENVKSDVEMDNVFTISNTFWFCLSAFMQQGIDILPKSVSGRLVTSVWWFFTLILVSSYTANLAAFLTVAKMGNSVESADDLAKQTDIKYGTVDNGSTKEFFRVCITFF
jgi:ABC-type amino acid transport substrate-binding protein